MEENKDLECGICLDLATEAVETTCCHQIFCESCLGGVETCPMCRKALIATPSVIIRRIIGRLPVPCTFCGATVERGSIKAHLLVCTERNLTCVVEWCDFKAKNEQLLAHTVEAHSAELTNPAYILALVKPPHTCRDRRPGVDLIAATRNSAGEMARLGSSGKFYCGGRLGFTCGCCNARCGPTDGCNCLSCFELDLETRALPSGYLLNKAGFPVRKGRRRGSWDGTMTFYCGRKVMNRNTQTDGWCGPTDGNNCSDCELIQQQVEGGCYNSFRGDRGE